MAGLEGVGSLKEKPRQEQPGLSGGRRQYAGATQVKVSLAALAGRSVDHFHTQVPDSLRALAERNRRADAQAL